MLCIIIIHREMNTMQLLHMHAVDKRVGAADTIEYCMRLVRLDVR